MKIKPRQENKQEQKKGRKEKRPPRKITETYLYNAGIYYLQRFAASRRQFETVMMRKINRSCRFHTDQKPEDCKKMLEDLMNRFEQSGLLNDAAYAKGLASSLRSRGKSKRAISARLTAKGIDRALIKNVCEESEENGNTEFDTALRFAQKKKLGPYAVKEQARQKSLQIFARAGFTYDMAQRILAMAVESEKEMDEDQIFSLEDSA